MVELERQTGPRVAQEEHRIAGRAAGPVVELHIGLVAVDSTVVEAVLDSTVPGVADLGYIGCIDLVEGRHTDRLEEDKAIRRSLAVVVEVDSILVGSLDSLVVVLDCSLVVVEGGHLGADKASLIYKCE